MMTPRKTNSDEQVSCGAAEFLRFISDAGEIRYVFVKAPHDNSARALDLHLEANADMLPELAREFRAMKRLIARVNGLMEDQ